MAEIADQLSTCDGLIESHGSAHLCGINKSSCINRLKLKGLLCFPMSGITGAGLWACTQPLWIIKWLSGKSSAVLRNEGISTFIFILHLCLWKAGTTKAEGWLCRSALDGKDTNSSLQVLQPHQCSGPGWSFLFSLEIPLRKFSQRGRFVKMMQGNYLRAVKFSQLHLIEASGLDSAFGFASVLQNAGGKPDSMVWVCLFSGEHAVPAATGRVPRVTAGT